SSITVSNASTVIVTVTDANGCTATAEKTLNNYPNPTASISGAEDICSGGSTIWIASGGSSFLWNTTDSGPALTVSTAGTYTVTITDLNGCTATAEKT